jgi:hypothetical protein
MIRHKSGTRWSDDREVGWRHARFTLYTWRRREARVFRFSLKTSGDGLSVVWPQNHYYDLVIWASKSPRWFLGLGLKTNGMRFVGLRLKIDGRVKMCEDTCWHLAACFGVKQVGLGFPYLASKLQRRSDRWCMWHHHRGRLEVKEKTDGSMASGAIQQKSDQSTLKLS